MKKVLLLIAAVCLCVSGAVAQNAPNDAVTLSYTWTGTGAVTTARKSEIRPSVFSYMFEPTYSGGLFQSLPWIGLAEPLRAVAHATATIKQTTGHADGIANEGVTIGPNTVCVDHIRGGVVLSHYCSHNLKTSFGVDEIAGYLGGNVGATFPSPIYINLSTDSASPDPSDCTAAGLPCTLAGLISTNGLSPSSSVYLHTNGTATYTLSHTWTASGTVADVQKAGLSTSSLVGCGLNCGFTFESAFTPLTLNANDQLAIVWTITIS